MKTKIEYGRRKNGSLRANIKMTGFWKNKMENGSFLSDIFISIALSWRCSKVRPGYFRKRERKNAQSMFLTCLPYGSLHDLLALILK